MSDIYEKIYNKFSFILKIVFQNFFYIELSGLFLINSLLLVDISIESDIMSELDGYLRNKSGILF